ncbi:MAG: antibiotic biosynthesis monooxygenase family protein [Rhodobacter sp.]|nr:antibiotic biosynthesis monooxygenase family protein [Rhodobacter sp.]
MTTLAQRTALSWIADLRKAATSALIAGSLVLSGATALQAGDAASQIDLVYVWTAKPGMGEQLVATYKAVGDVLEANEPGLLVYEIAVSETGDQIVIHEIFEDSEAMAFHLSGTAAQYFPQISQIAIPGPFIFRGDVPEELRTAAYQMDMGAIFTGDWSGFDRGE